MVNTKDQSSGYCVSIYAKMFVNSPDTRVCNSYYNVYRAMSRANSTLYIVASNTIGRLTLST